MRTRRRQRQSRRARRDRGAAGHALRVPACRRAHPPADVARQAAPMPLRPHPAATSRSPCRRPAAEAFTLDVLHFNDFHSRIESINAFELDLLGRGRGGGRVLRRRGAAEDRDRRGARRDRGRRRQRAGAERRRRVPGLAVLHHRAGAGRGRDDEPHRRSTRWSTATTSSTSGRSRWRSSSRRRTSRCCPATSTSRRTTCWRRWPRTTWCSRSAARRWRSSAATTPDTVEISSPGPTVSFGEPVAYLTDAGRGAGGRGRRQGHPAVASRRRRRHRASPRRCRGST